MSDPPLPVAPARLREHLLAGGVAALPTDTVAGLAVLAGPRGAGKSLARLKGSPPERPHTLHLRSPEDLPRFLPALPPGLPTWLRRALPRRLTVLLPRAWSALPQDWDWPWPEVGLRLPADPIYRSLVEGLPAPLLMTSINEAGRPPLTGRSLAAWLEAHPEVLPALDPLRVEDREASTVLRFGPLPELLRGTPPRPRPRPGLHVLVVCTGNTCRSPLAAALLERELAAAWGVDPPDLQELGWLIRSAGRVALPGLPANHHSIRAGREVGLELARHRSASLEDLLAQPWDLILGMEERHLDGLPPPARNQARLFDPEGGEVEDPFGGDLADYRRMRERLEAAVAARIQIWSSWG